MRQRPLSDKNLLVGVYVRACRRTTFTNGKAQRAQSNEIGNLSLIWARRSTANLKNRRNPFTLVRFFFNFFNFRRVAKLVKQLYLSKGKRRAIKL